MECWQDCAWELYPYTGRGWKIQKAWDQLCCSWSCLFSYCCWLLWLHWLPGCEISLCFSFLELRKHHALSECAGLAQLSPFDSFYFSSLCFRQASMLILAALAKATCDLLELLCFFHLPTFLIAIVLHIAQDLLIFFHNAVSQSTPLNPFFLSLLSTLLCLLSLLSPLDSLHSWFIWTVPPRPPFLSAFDWSVAGDMMFSLLPRLWGSSVSWYSQMTNCTFTTSSMLTQCWSV